MELLVDEHALCRVFINRQNFPGKKQNRFDLFGIAVCFTTVGHTHTKHNVYAATTCVLHVSVCTYTYSSRTKEKFNIQFSSESRSGGSVAHGISEQKKEKIMRSGVARSWAVGLLLNSKKGGKSNNCGYVFPVQSNQLHDHAARFPTWF